VYRTSVLNTGSSSRSIAGAFRGRAMRTAAFLLGVSALLTGCATPAQPLTSEELHRVNAASPEARVLSGEYEATFYTRWIGPIRTRLTIQPLFDAEGRPAGFKANTRPDVAWRLVGGLESVLGPIFAPFVFPRGMLVTWENALPGGGPVNIARAGTDSDLTPDRVIVPEDPSRDGSIGIGVLPSLRARTRLIDAPGWSRALPPFEILTREGKTVAVVTLRSLERAEPADHQGDGVRGVGEPRRASPPGAVDRGEAPTDFADLAASVARCAAERWFRLDERSRRMLRQYAEEIIAGAPGAADDLEMLFVAMMAARKHLRDHLLLLYRRAAPEESAVVEAVLGREADRSTPFTLLTDDAGGIVTIRYEALGGEGVIRESFRRALQAGARGLILDLRTCVGVDPTALLAAAPLLREPVEAVRLFAATARSAALGGDDDRSTPPPEPDPDLLRSWTLGHPGADDLRQIEALLDEGRIVRLSVHPWTDLRFDGPVAVLISPRTLSMAEPLAALLRSTGRARLFGEATAGRPVLYREFDVGQGWSVRIPAADALLARRDARPRQRVLPDVVTSRRAAPDAAARWLAEQLSTAATTGGTARGGDGHAEHAGHAGHADHAGHEAAAAP
jgi:hypothetical protein